MPPHKYVSGVRIVEDPEKGKLLVATRAFSAGEMVLVEPPLITFKSAKQAVYAYLRLSDKKKAQYMDTRHVNLAVAPPRFRKCREFSAEYLMSAASVTEKLNGVLTPEEVLEVMCVTQCNC